MRIIKSLVFASLVIVVLAIAIAFPFAGKAATGIHRMFFGVSLLPAIRPAPMFNTITVTTTADTIANDGQCSLREAITAANNNSAVNECAAGAGTDTITFNIPGAGVQTITLTSSLPGMNAPTIIDGSTQIGPGGTPLIEINANNNGGLLFQGGGSTVRSLIINRVSGDAITFQNTGNNTVAGCYIGTNSAGTAASANTGNGITILGPPNNTIGGTTAADRNVISGNSGIGILIQNGSASGNLIQGNYIGVNAAGTVAIPNVQAGIRLESAPNNTIGGTTEGAKNIISGNSDNGIEIQNGSATGNTIAGNFIGTDVTGAIAVGNGTNGIAIANGTQNNTIGGVTAAARNIISGNGTNGIAMITVVNLEGTTPPNSITGNYIGTNAAGTGALGNTLNGIICDNVPNTLVGGTTAGAANVISGNGQNGVRIINSGAGGTSVLGNFIGTDFTGTAALGNSGAGVLLTDVQGILVGSTLAGTGNIITASGGAGVAVTGASSTNNRISSNSIFGNTGIGIDLNNDGVTANDAGDGDNGPNNIQNFPLITDGTPVITGTLNSTASTTFRLEFFSNTAADSTGFGEGQTYLGFATVTTDGTGNAPFFFSSTQIAAGQFISATATNPNGNTSEFSQVFQATSPTSVQLGEAKAERSNAGVAIQWHSGLETQNLGFNVYRDNGNDKSRTLITPQTIAGSALITSDTAADNRSYSWVDQDAPKGARYWIEDIDLNGGRALHGPITPTETGMIEMKRSRLLTELNGNPENRVRQRGFPATASVSADLAVSSNETQSFAGPMTRAVVSKARQIAPRYVTSNISSSSLEGRSAAKIYVDHDGWYRVTADQLDAAGFGADIAPERLQLFNGNTQIPIQVNADHSIEFYGQGLDLPTTDARVYWLVTGKGQSLRINRIQQGQTVAASQNDFTDVTEQRYRTIYFSSLLNGDAENIFGPAISGSAVSEKLTLQNLSITNGHATLEIALQGVTKGPHLVDVNINGVKIGSAAFNNRDYGVSTLTIPAGVLSEGDNTVSLIRKGSATDISLLDYTRVTYQRQYHAINNRLTFGVEAGQSVRLTNFTTSQISLYDITNPQSVTQILATPEPDSMGFALSIAASSNARTMIALSDDTADAPVKVVANNPTNWRTQGHGADLLIITAGDFRASVAPLVQLRRAQGLRVEVADVEDVFDEFSFGVHTPDALKDFLSWSKAHWRIPPRFVLLVGDSTWDPRNYLGQGEADFVPTKLIDTSQMETASDDWIADFNGDGFPEMAVGRLPVRTAAQAEGVVAKIIAYEASAQKQGAALLVSDSGFESRNNQVRGLFPSSFSVATVNRSEGLTDADVRARILAAFNSGPSLVSYAGHGSVDEWTGSRLLTSDDAAGLTSGNPTSIMVLLTCLNGYSHDVFLNSLAKAMLLKPNGGAAAVWSSSGITTPDSQQQMAMGFYQKVFSQPDVMLGDAVLAAKRSNLNPDVRRTWILLGDPTTRFKLE